MISKELEVQWVDLFHRGNAKEITELHHPDAIHHQSASETVEGKKAIEAIFNAEYSAADMTCCIPGNIL